MVVEEGEPSLLPEHVADLRLQYSMKNIILEMYVLYAAPRHLMTWGMMRVSEKGCMMFLVAQVRADFVRYLLLCPFRTLTTFLADVSRLVVEFEVVGFMVMVWLVTYFVALVLVVIRVDILAWESVADVMIDGGTSKLILASLLGNTSYIVFFVVLGAGRGQNEGGVEFKVVVFDLVVMSIARPGDHFFWELAVAVRPGEPVVTNRFLK